MHGGGRLRFLERRELLPSPPKLPQEKDGADEETELGEMRVLAQGHTAGVEAEFELKPYSRAQSPPPPSAGGPEVPSSLFQSATAHAPPSGRQEQPRPLASPARERSWARVPSWLRARGASCATRADTFTALQAMASSLLPRPHPHPLPVTHEARDPLPS